MSLSFPSAIHGERPSYEASENLNKLGRVDSRGSKEQVITRTANECFLRIQKLSPGYFDGVTSWIKSNCVYFAAGAATAAAISLSGYGLWKVATHTTYAPHLVAGLCGSAWISSECGYRPIEYLKGLLAAAVRDSANRAANSSIKNDEKIFAGKEHEKAKCHEEIINQLISVYNDCAKELHARFQDAEIDKSAMDRVQLKEVADQLEKRLPAIEKLLTQLDLGKHEIEKILQTFKDKIHFVQRQICSLSPDHSYQKMNAELLAGWSIDAMHEIGVPLAIKERALSAKKSRFSVLDQCKGYARAAFAGVEALAASTLAFATITAACHAYQYGIADTMEEARKLFGERKLTGLGELSHTTIAGLSLGALGVVGATTGVVAKKGGEHHRAVKANAAYVLSEQAACAKDLQRIYRGVADHVKSLGGSSRISLQNALRERLPLIKNEIQKFGVVQDSLSILGNLEQVLANH